MANVDEMIERFDNLDFGGIVEGIASIQEERFREMQQLQLVQGKDRNGDWLPKYTDDMEYFKDVEAAIQYRDWKADISPDASKPKDVMDFWINGDFNSSIRAEIKNGNIDILSSDSIAPDILRKTGGKAFGLSPESIDRLWRDYIRPELLNIIKEQTGIK